MGPAIPPSVLPAKLSPTCGLQHINPPEIFPGTFLSFTAVFVVLTSTPEQLLSSVHFLAVVGPRHQYNNRFCQVHENSNREFRRRQLAPRRVRSRRWDSTIAQANYPLLVIPREGYRAAGNLYQGGWL